MATVPISPEVLRWARKYRGLDRASAAEHYGISEDELSALEGDEGKKPSVTLFKKIANKLKLPRATLARNTPPDIPPDPIDFRTFEGRPVALSLETKIVISGVRAHQKDYLELAESDQLIAAPILPECSEDDDPWELGRLERERLGITVDEQLDWGSADDAFKGWRSAIEASGVFVFVETFDRNDCRGFSIYDDALFPAVVISRDEKVVGARIYTLIHEYAHLLRRRPGVSDLDDRNPVESFCNRFAAGFLMPDQVLARALPFWPNEPVEWTDQQVRMTARRLKVTQQALALRLEQAGVAPGGFYRDFLERRGRWEPQPAPVSKEKKSGGNYVITQVHTLGNHFVGAVLSAVSRRVIDEVEASDILHLAPRHFPGIRERMLAPPLNDGGA